MFCMTKQKINHAMGELGKYSATDLLSHCVNRDLGLVYWDVKPCEVIPYAQTDYHTVSLYTRGGEKTRRIDQDQSTPGGPGKICFMPAGSDSRWHIAADQQLMHFYISADYFSYFLNASFGIDARNIQLIERTFLDDPVLQKLMYQQLLLPASEGMQNQLLLSQACQEIASTLAERYLDKKVSTNRYYGGLSGRHLKIVKEYIDTNYAQNISLNQLAVLCNLSEFHFARMFKAVCGISPYQYVQYIRINKSKEMLQYKQLLSIADISIECGYSNQSHFTKTFKLYTGMTPMSYKNQCL